VTYLRSNETSLNLKYKVLKLSFEVQIHIKVSSTLVAHPS